MFLKEGIFKIATEKCFRSQHTVLQKLESRSQYHLNFKLLDSPTAFKLAIIHGLVIYFLKNLCTHTPSFPSDTQICRSSSPLYKIVSYLHIYHTHSSVYFNCF